MTNPRKTENKIIADHGDYLEIDISTAAHPNTTLLVDSDIWRAYTKEIGATVWASSQESMYLEARYTHPSSRRNLRFHRFVLGHPPAPGLEPDHRTHGSHGVVDNRRSNLRWGTHSQNCQNRSRRSDNTSGVTGVSFDKRKNRWRSQIKANGRKIHLGWFLPGDLFNAVAARKSAELRYFKDFAYAANNA